VHVLVIQISVNFYNTVCWLLVIYCITFEHTCRIMRWMFYMPHFSTWSPSTSTALLQWETRVSLPFLYQFEFYTCNHFLLVNNLVITFKPIPKDSIFEGSKEVEIWGSKVWAGWWLENNGPCELCGCFLWFQMCVCLCCHVEGGFNNSLVR